MEAEKGIEFDYANNKKIKELGYDVEGVTVNGFVNKDGGVVLNVQSNKAWEFVVGHEITHILKSGVDANIFNELQSTLFKYAESKGELATRRNALEKLYKSKGINADIDEELTADLVGDYLFRARSRKIRRCFADIP